MKQQETLEKFIGHQFRDPALLTRALTHSSYANESGHGAAGDNERLEFLGDAVLELVSSDFLYHERPNDPEGDLTRLRASLVCEPALAFCTRALSLGDYLYLGKGEDVTGGRERPSILSDALEALIGAIYLDGGMEPAREFILRFILTDIEHKKLFHDSKTLLQEKVQGEYDAPLSYALLETKGPDHDRTFTVEARIGTKAYGRGSGRSKKAAEQEAAYQTLLMLERKRS